MGGVHPGAAMDVPSPDIEQDAVIEELSACFLPMTRHLPPRYRDAITLVELEGVTHREAAARHGISVSGMKFRVQRGRRMVKRMLEE